MAQVWKIAPGEHADHWPLCRDRGCIVIGWRALKDYRRFKNKDAILKALGGGPGDGRGAARSIWRFTREVQSPDVVVANKGRDGIVGIGVVDSEYLPPGHPKNPSDSEWLPNARLVKWIVKQPIELPPFFFGIDTVHSLSAKKIGQIKEAYARTYPKLKKTVGRLFDGVPNGEEGRPETKKLLESVQRQLTEESAFDPAGIKDARQRILSSIVRRRGQPAFRKQLLSAYNRRCAVTGCRVEAVLEAAHIIPYRGTETNHPANGLLLRADFHTLFDLGLVAVDVMRMRLLVSRELNGTIYANYRGKRITIPRNPASQPSQKALEQHRRDSGLT